MNNIEKLSIVKFNFIKMSHKKSLHERPTHLYNKKTIIANDFFIN